MLLSSMLQRLFLGVFLFLSFFFFPQIGQCASLNVDGSSFTSYLWVVPFVCMLLSIALLPLIAPHFWHKHFGKVAVFWAAAFLIPFGLVFSFPAMMYQIVETLFDEYIPFIVLLLALFTISGGIRLKGSLVGTPLVNVGILFIGTLFASWMGTTGAAMLLIRPLLKANEYRKHKVHSVIFFIFLVANAGGCLTPLGDPPLFLGFLKGVRFFWTFEQLIGPMLFLCTILLSLYYCLDLYYYKKEGSPAESMEKSDEKLSIEGGINCLLLLCVVASVLMSGIWNPQISFTVYQDIEIALQNGLRDFFLLTLVFVSLYLTPKALREANDFSWEPIAEVGKLFLGIFFSMIPAIEILKAGDKGILAPVIALVSNANGEANNVMYFWLSGILSSFLDNAPTYLVFFNTAGGDAASLMTTQATTLMAISAGSVFMGANTYIGNAPNFMVRSIAESSGVKMPSFFGYMGWSLAILIPCFILFSLVFI